MGKKITEKRARISRKKVIKPSLSETIAIYKDETDHNQYNHLNMKVQNTIREMGLDSEKFQFINNPDEIKISAVILKLVEPSIRKYWGNEVKLRGIITLAVIAWNLTFLTQKNQIEMQEMLIEELLPKDFDALDVSAMIEFLENFQEQKRSLYPDIKTFIMGYDLRFDGENMHLDISSLPLGDAVKRSRTDFQDRQIETIFRKFF